MRLRDGGGRSWFVYSLIRYTADNEARNVEQWLRWHAAMYYPELGIESIESERDLIDYLAA